MTNRLDRMMARIQAHGVSCALVHTPENIRYLTDYAGEGCLLVSDREVVLFTDFRYVEQAQRLACGLRVVQCGGAALPVEQAVREVLQSHGAAALGVEEEWLTVAAHKKLAAALGEIELKPIDGIVPDLRMVKDEHELALIERACRISCDAFSKMLGIIKPGMTEKQIQIELDYTMLSLGADCAGFDTIACAGVNASLPHAVPSEHAVAPGELLTLDFGAQYMGYKSDMTRTIAISSVSAELRNIYDTVLAAQLAALAMIGPGVACRDVDARAREIIDGKYPGRFGHGLGHGVGLNIHEQPNLNTRDTRLLAPGQVVTVEPGIYVPGLGGCRIEDCVVITRGGFRNLIDAPKELLVI